MNLETHKKIVKALDRALADLSLWLERQGLSQDQLISQLNDAMRENGMLAQIILGAASNLIPSADGHKVEVADVGKVFSRIQSGEFAAELLTRPEPSPEQLNELLSMFKIPLPDFRQHLQETAAVGPHHKGGGRPKKLEDPAVRERIRAEIKDLRMPGKRLEDIFRRLAMRHDASPTTIKRIWLEGTDRQPTNE